MLHHPETISRAQREAYKERLEWAARQRAAARTSRRLPIRHRLAAGLHALAFVLEPMPRQGESP